MLPSHGGEPLPAEPVSPFGRRGRLRAWLPWLAVLAVAALLRAPDLTAGWPYLNYVDEGHLLRPAAVALRAGSWDTGDFNYPTLPAYLAAATAALDLRLRGAGGLAPRGLYEERFYDVLPPALLRAGRLWSFAFSLGIVLAASLLARALADSRSGWLAAWIAALLPALVIRGGNANVDVAATFFTLLAFVAAERSARCASDRPSAARGHAALAGLAAGLAVTAKYTMALALPAIGLRLLLGVADRRRKAQSALAVALGGAAGLVLGMPALVLAPARVWEGVVTQSSRYREIALGALWEQAVRRAEWTHPFDGPEVGYLFLALVVAGGWRLAREPRGRAALPGLSLFALGLLLPLLAYDFRPFRNLLPAVALGCALAGCALGRLAARGRRSMLAAALVPALLYGPPGVAYARSRLGLVDSRRQAVDELVAGTGRRAPACVARELAVLPSELARLPAGSVFVPALGGRFAPSWAGCDLALLPTRALAAVTLCQPEPVVASAACFEEIRRFGETAVALDPSLHRGNRQKIHLLERRLSR